MRPRTLALALAPALAAGLLPAPPSALAEAPPPSRVLVESLDDPILRLLAEEALQRNPEIAALRDAAAAARQVPASAGAPPDPMIGLAYWLEPPETRVGPQELMLSASQRIPWKGKLASQARAAEADADAAEASVEARRVAVVTELRRWYLELAYLGAEEDVVREELSLLAHFEELSRARYEAGTGLQQAPIKIQAEITELQLRLLDLEARRASARAALSSLLDRPADRPVTVAPLPTRAVVPVLSTLRAAAFGGRPELAAADDAIAAADARVDRARRERFPDVTTGLSWTLVGRREDAPGRANPPPDDGQDVLALTASANLPVWRGRLRALVEEAALRRQAVGWRKRALLAAIDREITDTLSRLAASAEQLDLYRAVLVPQAEQSLESVLAAYAAGAVGALDLLDAERVAFRVRVGTERARADHAIAVARLEGAIAAPLASLPGASGPAPAPAQEDRP